MKNLGDCWIYAVDEGEVLRLSRRERGFDSRWDHHRNRNHRSYRTSTLSLEAGRPESPRSGGCRAAFELLESTFSTREKGGGSSYSDDVITVITLGEYTEG
jgi:hypothetical protein